MKKLAPFVIVLVILFLYSPDKQLFAVSSLLLLFLVRFSWRNNEPKIIFLGMIFYWLTVCTLMVYGIFFNKPLIELTLAPETFVFTTYLALLATLCYCSGILLIINKSRVDISLLYTELKKYSGKKLLLFYCLYSVFSSLFGNIALLLGGFSQIGIGVVWLKWAFLTILIVHTQLFPGNKKWVYVVLIFEVILSFTGFWSSFKDYLFIGAAAFLTFSTAVNTRRALTAAFFGIAAFFLMVIWTVVKGEYRQYLTGGERSFAIVQQSRLDNLQKLSAITGTYFSSDNFTTNFTKGILDLANRVNYTEYFAMSVREVPSVLPYEEGSLLEAAFEHVFKPRLFFPDKKTIDDSEITSKYTGRQFAGAEYGTSFSLGLVAERYIDYGPVYMFIPIFLLGLFLGLVYKYIFTHSLNTVWGISFVAPLFFFIPSLGLATTKFLGWIITYFIVWYLFNKYLINKIDTFLQKTI